MVWKAGFSYDEAALSILLCIDLEGSGVGPASTAGETDLRSQGWQPIFSGDLTNRGATGANGIGPFDNAWKLWKMGESARYAVVVRGTIPRGASIIEDLLSTTMNAAEVSIPLSRQQTLNFPLAITEGAAVHAGFTLGLAALIFDKTDGIVQQLQSLPSGSEILVVGHSQGSAIATLLHSFLHYAASDPRFGLDEKGFSVKSYVFAQPKPGNWQYSLDLAQVAANKGLTFCVNNTLDWVPQVPLALQSLDEITNDPILPFLKEHAKVGWIVESGLAALANSMVWLKDHASGLVSSLTDRVTILENIIDPKYIEKGGAQLERVGAISLNYIPCGMVLGLAGDPSQSTDTDLLAQHHATTYQHLMQQQLVDLAW
uniref:Fungal lipase-type domain-containing protein n=1 Tax=mine drainage metagenome TaxID=410659 RepID=E6QDV4_9ZZZZ